MHTYISFLWQADGLTANAVVSVFIQMFMDRYVDNCACVHIRIYVCMCVCVCARSGAYAIRVCVCVCVFACVRVRVCVSVHWLVSEWVCMYTLQGKPYLIHTCIHDKYKAKPYLAPI